MLRQISAAGGAFALLGLYLLSWLPASDPSPADKVTLFFLATSIALVLLPAVWRTYIFENEDAATFLLIAVAFVLYQLADRVGPETGPGLHLKLLPDNPFVFSFAWYLSVLGGIFALPSCLRKSGPERAIWAALTVVGVLGGASFWGLKHFYQVSVTDGIDPTPVVTLYIQIVGYGALALCCRAIALDEKVRKYTFLALPVALYALWARHTFMPSRQEADE